MKLSLACLIVFVVAAALLSVRLAAPSGYVFDEVVYSHAASSLLAGSNPEDSHPPLGKLAIAAGIHLLGDSPAAWRVPSVLAGAATLALIFWWTYLLGGAFPAGLAVALTVVDCLWLVMARAGSLDMLATCLVLGGVVTTTAVLKRKLSPYWLALAGLSLGLAMATKWLALVPLAVCMILALAWFGNKAIAPLVAMLATFALGYLAPFLVLARLLHETPTLAWLSWQQAQIVRGHVDAIGPIMQTSHWWTWPLKTRAQALYIDGSQHILLLGNPVVMWLGLGLAILVLSALVLRRQPRAWIPALFYFVLYLQYAVMPLKSEFYHYYLAAGLCLAPVVALTLPRRAALGVTAAAAILFLAVLPALTSLPRGHWGETNAWIIPPYTPPERLDLLNVSLRPNGSAGTWYVIRHCGDLEPAECATRGGREEGQEIPPPIEASSDGMRVQYTWLCVGCAHAKIEQMQVWDGKQTGLQKVPSALVLKFPQPVALEHNDLLQLSYAVAGGAY